MPSAKKIKTLIVDDQSSILAILNNSLLDLGFVQIEQKQDGEEAYEYLKENPTHLVISDYNMPKMNGLELLKAVRSNPNTQKVGFVMLTSEATPELLKEAMANKVNNFMAKPYTPAKLREVLEGIFGKITP